MNPSNSYVKALISLSHENDYSSKISEDVSDFLQMIIIKPEIYEFILNVNYSWEDKEEFINVLKENNFSEYFVNFLKVIIIQKQQRYLKEILNKFELKELENQNIIIGKIFTTDEISSEKIQELEQVFSKKMNKQVKLNSQIDKELISGIKVVINDYVYNYSIDQKLKLIKKELLS